MDIQQTLSDMHAIDAAIRKGGIAAGMQLIATMDPSASLRDRHAAVNDPIFAPALQAYADRRWQEYRTLENSPEAIAWYRRRIVRKTTQGEP